MFCIEEESYSKYRTWRYYPPISNFQSELARIHVKSFEIVERYSSFKWILYLFHTLHSIVFFLCLLIPVISSWFEWVMSSIFVYRFSESRHYDLLKIAISSLESRTSSKIHSKYTDFVPLRHLIVEILLHLNKVL